MSEELLELVFATKTRRPGLGKCRTVLACGGGGGSEAGTWARAELEQQAPDLSLAQTHPPGHKPLMASTARHQHLHQHHHEPQDGLGQSPEE